MFKSLRWVMALLGTIGVAAALAVAAQGYHFINKLDASATKAYVAKDVVADILRNRVLKRGKGAEVWGWGTAYGSKPAKPQGDAS